MAGPAQKRPSSSATTGISSTDAVFSLVNGVLGAGLLGLPFCYKQSGLILTSLLLLVCWVTCNLSVKLLLSTSKSLNIRTYQGLARTTLGSWGAAALNAGIVSINLGCLVAYINIISDVMSSVAGTIIPPGAEPSRNVLMSAVALLGALPVSLTVTDPRLITSVSFLCVSMVFVFIAVLTIFALSPIPGAVTLVAWRSAGLSTSFPMLAFGFTAQPIVFPVYNTLAAGTPTRMRQVVSRAALLVCLCYMVVGVAGYTAFRQRCLGDVLRNLGGPRSAGTLRGMYEQLVKLGYGLSILGSFPILMMPLNAVLSPMLAGLAPHGKTSGSEGHAHSATAVCCILLALSIAVLVPNVEFVFGLVGATSSVLVAYLLPAAIYLADTWGHGGVQLPTAPPSEASSPVSSPPTPTRRPFGGRVTTMQLQAAGLLVFGLVTAVVCTQATFAAVQEEHAVVELVQKMVLTDKQVDAAQEREKRAQEMADTALTIAVATKDLDVIQQGSNENLKTLSSVASAFQTLSNSTAKEVPWYDVGGKLTASRQDASNQSKLKKASEELSDVRRKVNTTIGVLDALTQTMEQKEAAAAAAAEAEQPADAVLPVSIPEVGAGGGSGPPPPLPLPPQM